MCCPKPEPGQEGLTLKVASCQEGKKKMLLSWPADKEEAALSISHCPALRCCHNTRMHDMERGLPETHQVPGDTLHMIVLVRLRAGREGRRHVPPLLSESVG